MIIELWGVVNNAGLCFVGTPEIMAQQDINNVINVNFQGTVNVTKKFLPLIRRSKGRIVNVGSLNGKFYMTCNYRLLMPHKRNNVLRKLFNIMRSETKLKYPSIWQWCYNYCLFRRCADAVFLDIQRYESCNKKLHRRFILWIKRLGCKSQPRCPRCLQNRSVDWNYITRTSVKPNFKNNLL